LPGVATNPDLDVVMTTLGGEQRPLGDFLTFFHLASVVVDPYTNESSWVLRAAVRILDDFRGADVRVNFVATCSPTDAKLFFGPLADQFTVFCDPERALVRSLGLAQLPAFVFVRLDGSIGAYAEGWNPEEWRAVAEAIATTTRWTRPTIPLPGDPGPFHGTPALGA
jgi:hypothetical protein